MSLRLIKIAIIHYKSLGFRGFLKRASTYLLRRRQTLLHTLPLISGCYTRYLAHRLMMNRKPLKLHLGCGSVHLNDYVNVDIQDWAGACDLIADARNLHMFRDNCVDHIFNHALLEHIPPWDTGRSLTEWNRVLRPGGTIQIEVPDLERVFQDWLIDKTLGEEEAINNIYGGFKSPNKAYIHQHHLTGFTYDRLTRMMRDCGFINFKRLEHPKYHHILVVYAQKAVM